MDVAVGVERQSCVFYRIDIVQAQAVNSQISAIIPAIFISFAQCCDNELFLGQGPSPCLLTWCKGGCRNTGGCGLYIGMFRQIRNKKKSPEMVDKGL